MAEAPGKQDSLGVQMFRETAMRKMASADDLDRYLKVTNPSAWVLVGAVAALIVAALVWASTASLPITTITTGVLKDGQIMCFLPIDDEAPVTAESKVLANGYETHIVSVNDNPHSQREVAAALSSDYAVESLHLAQWSCKVIVALPDELSSWEEGDDVPVQITTREVAPLAYLFGGTRS